MVVQGTVYRAAALTCRRGEVQVHGRPVRHSALRQTAVLGRGRHHLAVQNPALTGHRQRVVSLNLAPTEVTGQRSEVRGQRSEVRGQRSRVIGH